VPAQQFASSFGRLEACPTDIFSEISDRWPQAVAAGSQARHGELG